MQPSRSSLRWTFGVLLCLAATTYLAFHRAPEESTNLAIPAPGPGVLAVAPEPQDRADEEPTGRVSPSHPDPLSSTFTPPPGSAGPPSAPAPPGVALLDGRALDRLAALQAEKESRPPAETRLSSDLIRATRSPGGGGDLARDDQDRIRVEVTAQVTENLLAEIRTGGGSVIHSFPEYNSVQAWVAAGRLSALAGHEDVRFVQPFFPPLSNTGPIIWEGDVTHRAAEARVTFSVTGRGIKVGVLSDSVDHMAASQAAGELGPVTVLPGQEGKGDGEGTAMLEIVHDLAPGADLLFASGFNGVAAFADNIVKLRQAGCQIIVDDITYFNQPAFQDGVIARAVNQVTADGALFFSSAANSGNKNDGTSCVWEGDFVSAGDITLTIDGQAVRYQIHAFGPKDHNVITRGGRAAILKWSDPAEASGNDYDLLLLNEQNQVVFVSNTTQNGTQPPLEIISGEIPNNYKLAVLARAGTPARFLRLEVPRGGLEASTAGSTYGHNAAERAISVAAVDVNTSFPQAFEGGAKNPVQRYSSDGPRHIFYHPDGTPITPGNFLSTGGRILNKPDIAAADNGMTSVPGFRPFGGTSAAAPTAAAIAALVWSYNPNLTAAQVFEALKQSALDIEAPGWDRDSGHGLIKVPAALQAVPNPQLPTLTGFVPTSGAVGTRVAIEGTKLAEVTAVRFNEIEAPFTFESATRLSATVPAGARTGRIVLLAPTGSATSTTDFTVLQEPAITGFTPAFGAVGTVVTINGDHFTGTSAVRFGNLEATFTVESAARLRATVPTGAGTGRITVTTAAGTATSQGLFTVETRPGITDFSPGEGGSGTVVVIDGVNLTGTTAVRFAGTTATFTLDSAVRITATVPAGASTGPIEVTTPNGTAASTRPFTFVPAPTLTAFSPTTGPVGTRVSLTGSHLNAVRIVEFGSVRATTVLAESDTQLSAWVPPGAGSGPIRVTSPGGSAVTVQPFTVLAAPPNDAFASAQPLNGQSGTVTGGNVGSSKEPGEPAHGGNEGGRSVWYRWTAPASGTWEFSTSGSTFDTLLAVYRGNTLDDLTLVAQNNDDGDAKTSRVTFLATAGVTYAIAVDGFYSGTLDPPVPASGTLVLQWQADVQTPVITLFTPDSGPVGTAVTLSGVNFQGITTVSFDGHPAAFTLRSATEILTTVPGGAATGRIRVTSPGGTATTLRDFQVTVTSNNDHFTDAQLLTGQQGSVTGRNLEATKEPGEPPHGGNPGGRSVWYRWTAPDAGLYVFNTLGSDFDTLLGVYIGPALHQLTELAGNDDGGVDLTSAILLPAAAGSTYQIAVDGYGGASGNVVLNWAPAGQLPEITGFSPLAGPIGTSVTIDGNRFTDTTGVAFAGTPATTFTAISATRLTAVVPPGATTGRLTVFTPAGTAVSDLEFVVGRLPDNDRFADALRLPATDHYQTGSNVGAGRETGEPNHAGDPGGRSIWYRWTAPATGVWIFDTLGSDFDTLLAIYRGETVNTLTRIVENDDGTEDFSSRVVLEATAGTEYRIAVDGYAGDSGDVVLRSYREDPRPGLYATGSEEVNAAAPLAGQRGWQSDGSGGNGIVEDYLPGLGKQAYIGYWPPNFGDRGLLLWHDLNHLPDQQPVLEFTVTMAIVDSLNRAYDTFYWAAYNHEGHRLALVAFDNETLDVVYALDDGQGFRPTGVSFENNRPFELRLRMDFAANRWSAVLDGQTVIQEQPLTLTGAPLNLADLDAGWLVANTFWPGDNYMIFDNYRVALAGDPQPVLRAPPVSQTVNLGEPAIFAVIAQGEETLRYEWLKEGQPVPNATGPVLILSTTGPADAGGYQVRVSNRSGSVTSTTATLTVQQPLPIITSPPLARTAVAGNDVRFSVVAVGAPPLRYQWRRNGADLSGETGVSILLRRVSMSEAGEYTVQVTNPSGSALSPPAALVVEPPASFADWVVAHLGGYPLADQGALADADRDGWSNMGEYALGTRPDDPASRPQLEATLTDIGGVPHFVLSFVPNPTARGVAFSAEFSSTLHPPDWRGTDVIEISAGPPRVLGRVVAPGAQSGFLRLKISLQE